MKKRMIFAGILGLAAVAVAVGAWWSPSLPWASPKPASATAPAVLKPGVGVVLPDGSRLKLIEVQDSRCPMDAVCIRAGEAVVLFALEPANGSPSTVLEVIFEGEPAVETVGDYRIEVTDVQPYPMASQPTDPADFEVTVLFSGK